MKLSRFKIYFLLLFMAALSGCGSIGGSGQCGGAESSAACVTVDSIVPINIMQSPTASVDVVQVNCFDTSGNSTGSETFGPHLATITFSNSALPGAIESTNPKVTLTSYQITYTQNECPGSNCPNLDPVLNIPSMTLTIPPGETVTQEGFEFFPLRKVAEYLSKNGPTTDYPSYTANYIFEGTNSFGKLISVEAHTSFVLGNFDNCNAVIGG